MKICGIYKITSPSGKVYIGQSVDILNRWSKYKNAKINSQPKIYNSIKKYGSEKHIFEIICQCDESELNNLEKYYVDLFQCFDSKHGLNLIDGGGSTGRRSKESIQKQIETKKERYKKENHPNFGKHHPQSVKDKIRNSEKNKIIPLDVRENMRISHLGKYRNPVIQYDKDGVFIKEWKGVSQVNLVLGYDASGIVKACKGKVKLSHGFIWKYKNV